MDVEFCWLAQNIVERYTKLAGDLRNDIDFQLSIQCKDEYFTIHKYVLLSRSPVFKTMFQGTYLEAEKNQVNITDFEPETVKKMIEFCETDRIHETDGHEVELYKIARKYQIDSLMIFTYTLMINTLSFENVSDRLQIALMFNDQKLTKFLNSWIIQNIEYIRFTPGFSKLTNDQIADIFRP